MLDYSDSEVLPADFPTLKKEIAAICRQMHGEGKASGGDRLECSSARSDATGLDCYARSP